MLLIDNQIQANRNRLAQIEDRYYVKQHSLREKLNNQLKDNRRQKDYQALMVSDIDSKLQKLSIENQMEQQKTRTQISSLQTQLDKIQLDHQDAIQEQQHKIEDLTSKLHGIRETRTLTRPMQSQFPMGPRKSLVLLAAVMGGLFLGVFIAFMLEFLSRVNERKNLPQA